MTLVLGLTGGIATGKSTVSDYFKQQGHPVIDADIGARIVMEPHRPAFNQVVDTFGQTILQEDNSINRKKLGSIVFNNPEQLSRLNAIVSEAIYKWIMDEKKYYLEKEVPLLVLDIPLLFEANYEKDVDEIMVVYTSMETQITRLRKRDQLTRKEALIRISAQDPIEEKVQKADTVINNEDSIENTLRQVKKWLEEKGC